MVGGVGVTTTWGPVLKGRSVRKVQNHRAPAVITAQEVLSLQTMMPFSAAQARKTQVHPGQPPNLDVTLVSSISHIFNWLLFFCPRYHHSEIYHLVAVSMLPW